MGDHIDVAALKRAISLVGVLQRYGVAVHPRGNAFVGRCPFHLDRGRPNLYVYPASGRYHCYRCSKGGDVISFVQAMDQLPFRDAIKRLSKWQGSTADTAAASVVPCPRSAGARAQDASSLASGKPPSVPSTTAEECACLDVAAALYEQQLSVTLQARRYLARRGLTAATLRACHVGFATGGTLTHTLEARGVPISAAHRVGLLRGDGRETLSGRIVVPEWHAEHSDWMIGRLLEDEADHPKYLGLPGRKPLLGWGTIASSSHVILTEGVFDWLLLRQWDYPALCLLGTHASVAVLSALRRFGRLYLALDADGAGQEATARLVDLLGHRAVPISLPSGMQDVADLGPRPDGRARFARALEGAERLAAA